MTLRDQKVSIPLAKGVNAKIDPKLVSPDQFNLESENARIEDGTNKKRFGYQRAPINLADGSSPSSLNAFGKRRNEALVFGGSKAFSVSETTNSLIDKGNVIGVDIDRLDIDATASNKLGVDSAEINGVICELLFSDTSGAGLLEAVLIEKETETQLSKIEISTSAVNGGRVIAAANQFCIFYNEGNALEFASIAFNNPTSVFQTDTVSSAASDVFDVVQRANDQVFVALHDSANNNIEYGFYNINSGAVNTANLAFDAEYCIRCLYDPNTDYIWIVASGVNSSDYEVRYYIYDSGLNQIADTQIDVDALTAFERVSAALHEGELVCFYEQTNQNVDIEAALFNAVLTNTINLAPHKFYPGQEITFTMGTPPTGLTSGNNYFMGLTASASSYAFYDSKADAINDQSARVLTGTPAGTGTITSNETNPVIFKATADDQGNVTKLPNTAAGFAGTVRLASQPFVSGDEVFVLVDFESDLQSTSFLLLSDVDSSDRPSVVAKTNFDVCKGFLRSSIKRLPEATRLSSEEFFIANAYRTSATNSDGVFLYQTAANGHFYRLDTASRYFNAEINKNTLIAGGIVKSYDGEAINELNFNNFPENVTAVDDSSAGSLAAGDYGFQVIYEWTDKQGNRHRSAPSVAQTVTASGSSQVNLSIPYLFLTEKPLGQVQVVVYMTRLNGSIYYRRATYLMNSAPSDRERFFIVGPIASQPEGTEEVLYTTGGVLENTAPPPSRIIATSKNRCFLVNAENKLDVWYSNQAVPTQGIGFNSVLSRPVAQSADDISAIQTMDDKIILWKPAEIYFFSGNGPNLLGVNNTFTETQLITNQVGSNNQDSVEFMKDGCVFQSGEKGIWLLGRDLSVQYVGAAVEAFNGERITSANNIRSANEVRFTTETGTQLVFNYLSQEWITDTNIFAKDAIVINDQFQYISTKNELLKQSNDYLDGDKPIQMSITTPWIKLSGISGFQRVKRAIVLGAFRSAHKLKVDMAFDYEDYFRETLIWDASEVLATTSFGDDSFFGEDAFFGGNDDGVYQVRLHLPRQKCQSIKFRFTDITSSVRGESMELTSLDLLVGVKKGLNKLGSDKSI